MLPSTAQRAATARPHDQRTSHRARHWVHLLLLVLTRRLVMSSQPPNLTMQEPAMLTSSQRMSQGHHQTSRGSGVSFAPRHVGAPQYGGRRPSVADDYMARLSYAQSSPTALRASGTQSLPELTKSASAGGVGYHPAMANAYPVLQAPSPVKAAVGRGQGTDRGFDGPDNVGVAVGATGGRRDEWAPEPAPAPAAAAARHDKSFAAVGAPANLSVDEPWGDATGFDEHGLSADTPRFGAETPGFGKASPNAAGDPLIARMNAVVEDEDEEEPSSAHQRNDGWGVGGVSPGGRSPFGAQSPKIVKVSIAKPDQETQVAIQQIREKITAVTEGGPGGLRRSFRVFDRDGE